MTEKISAAEINLDELLRWYEEHQAKKEWDKEHTYLIDIIKILHGRKWGVRKVDLDGTVYEKRFTDGEPMPKKFSETIQSVLNNYVRGRRMICSIHQGQRLEDMGSPQRPSKELVEEEDWKGFMSYWA